MNDQSKPEPRIVEKPLHSADYRSSIPDGAVIEPGRSGILVGATSQEQLTALTRTLDSVGLRVNGIHGAAKLALELARVLQDGVATPEVVVVALELLDDDPTIIEKLERAGCLDSMLVLLPESWPRGVLPSPLDSVAVLQEPFPNSLLIEVVAQKMTPASIAT